MSDSDDTDYLASESSDEDLELFLGVPRQKNENYLGNTVHQYDEETFLTHFRVRRAHTHRFAEEYANSDMFRRQCGQYGKLSALSQILIFLWYLGHQTASFRDVSDRFGITTSSLHRIVKRVCVFFSNLSFQSITWPDNNEKKQIEMEFRERGFPNIIGVIDGCHLKIDKPQNDPDSYMNRKGFYSIQMQVVCNDRRQIRDVFIGYPGSAHDARVFRNSPLSANLQEMCGRYVLIGDSAYPLKTNLLVPFKDRGQLSQQQINYNVQLSKSRYVIEHTFGILKQKFRQLYHIKLRDMVFVAHLIRASCVLHNVCINDEFQFDASYVVEDNVLPPQNDVNDDEEVDDNNVDARRIRDHFVTILRARTKLMYL